MPHKYFFIFQFLKCIYTFKVYNPHFKEWKLKNEIKNIYMALICFRGIEQIGFKSFFKELYSFLFKHKCSTYIFIFPGYRYMPESSADLAIRVHNKHQLAGEPTTQGHLPALPMAAGAAQTCRSSRRVI